MRLCLIACIENLHIDIIELCLDVKAVGFDLGFITIQIKSYERNLIQISKS